MASLGYEITKIDWDWFPEKYNDIIVHYSDNTRELCKSHRIEIGAMDSLSCVFARGYIIYIYMYTGEVEHHSIEQCSTELIKSLKEYKERYGTK